MLLRQGTFEVTPKKLLAAKVESLLLRGARDYFEREGFAEIVVPHVTRATGACENIGTMFQLEYFGRRAFLVQTGQLYLEALLKRFPKVFCIGSSFRAEPLADERHLAEFTLVEMELACDFRELLEGIEELVYSMFVSVLKNKDDEMMQMVDMDGTLGKVRRPFKRVTYTKALEILSSEYGLKWGEDLKREHEAYVVEALGNQPLFITHYPEPIKFFNMRNNDADPSVVNSADLILPYSGESVGSAEREYRYPLLREKLKKSSMLRQLEERGGSINDFDWYLDLLRREGSVPHAGSGVGLNRVTQFVLGTQDIRETTPFPLNCETLM